MKAVVALGNGVLELNYMWLPTCIGMNALLKREMERELSNALTGKPLDEVTLNEAHDLVVKFIVQHFTYIKGLEMYLDGLKYLEVHT